MEAPAPLRKPLALVLCDIVGSLRLVAQEGDLVASAVFREFFEHAGRLARRQPVTARDAELMPEVVTEAIVVIDLVESALASNLWGIASIGLSRLARGIPSAARVAPDRYRRR